MTYALFFSLLKTLMPNAFIFVHVSYPNLSYKFNMQIGEWEFKYSTQVLWTSNNSYGLKKKKSPKHAWNCITFYFFNILFLNY